LINNAGIQAEMDGTTVIGAADLTADVMRRRSRPTSSAWCASLHAFLPLLQRSAAPVVVNVSSGLASLTRVATPGTPAYAYRGVAYPASKTAVNMITVQYAKAFPNMRINAVEPGFTRTDLNGNTGIQTVEQGAEIIVRMAQVGPDGPTGGYFDAEGPSSPGSSSAAPGNPRQARPGRGTRSGKRAAMSWRTACSPARAHCSAALGLILASLPVHLEGDAWLLGPEGEQSGDLLDPRERLRVGPDHVLGHTVTGLNRPVDGVALERAVRRRRR
jgi:hypothetical protein